MLVTNWGKYPTINANLIEFDSEVSAKDYLADKDEIITRGLGRCYGDSSLSKNILSSLRYNHFLTFDQNLGIIRCEAGASLADILESFVKRGWFLPVTPGTKFITVGGAIASDVHGKNHHKEKSFGFHVLSFKLLLADGSVVECSKDQNSDLFYATIGGMGLTGIILEAAFKLKRIESAYIRQETLKAYNLDEIMEYFEQSQDYTYSVAWIDCLAKNEHIGRSILMRGEHALEFELPQNTPLLLKEKRKLNIPIDLPSFLLNPISVKAFNELYFSKAPKYLSKSIVDYDTFFYPLDSIHNWNRIYGKRGFTQYQFVLPKESSQEGLKAILKKIAQSNQGSFLAVLKLFGKQESLISFPMEGYTLALDFPLSKNV
ncbi:MAG: FAD-binding oxidoreductase, partial [Candidatus Parvarchaeota archaeon]